MSIGKTTSPMQNAHSDPKRTHRSPLVVRIALAVAAFVLVVIAGICAINLYAITSYNAATQALNTNLKSASKTGTDLDVLRTQQQQADAQFEDAQTFDFLLLPDIKEAIHTNSNVSQTLTTRTQREIVQLKKQAERTTLGDGNDEQDSDTTKQGGGLTEEQRAKIEELLKSNEQSTPSQDVQGDGDGTADAGTSTDATVKPW